MKKRLFSLILTMAMMLSVISTVNVGAADTKVDIGDSIENAIEIQIGTNYTCTIADDVARNSAHYLKFEAQEDGYYDVLFECYTDWIRTLAICTEFNQVLDTSDKKAYENNSSVRLASARLEANQTYYLKIYEHYSIPSGTFGIKINYKGDKVADELNSAAEISYGEKFIESIDGWDDVDWFKYTNGNSTKTLSIKFTNIKGCSKSSSVYNEYEEQLLTFTEKNYIYGPEYDEEITLAPNQTIYFKVWCGQSVWYRADDNKYSFLINEKQCEHKTTSKKNYVTEYEEIQGNKNNHYVIKYYDKVCDECGATAEERIQESKHSENHNFYGSYCNNCDFEKEPDPIPETGSNEPIDGKTSFGSEVSEWAEQEMEEAYDNGLVPDVLVGNNLTEKIDRAEFAAIAVKLYETLTNTNTSTSGYCPFNDISYTYCYNEIKKAYYLNITTGTSDTTFEPYTLITREQLATMLCRAIKKYSDNSWNLENDSLYYLDTSGVSKFADDADISDYAKPSVYYMAKMGIIKGVDGSHFAPKNTSSYQEASGYAMATREQALAISLRIFKLSYMWK